MNAQADIAERITIISGLIERREIYRAVSARVALITGTLATLTAVAIYLNDEVTRFLGRPVRPREFAFAWIDVFIISAVAMVVLLARAARANGDRFPSPRTKLALSLIAPCLVIPLAFVGWFFGSGYLGAGELQLVTAWIAFYGLALLATSVFAPRSLSLLGWAFLLSALGVLLLADRIDDWTGNVSATAMGVTFGLYHLAYAIGNWKVRGLVAAQPEMR